MLSQQLQEQKNVLGKLPDRITSLGYNIIFTTNLGRIVCDECAKEVETENIEMLENFSTYDEGPDIECDECGSFIESNYGQD